EVDIGSEDERADDSMLTANPPTSTRDKRALPAYIQNRYNDEDVPDELPINFKEGIGRKPRTKKVAATADADDDATPEDRTPVMGRPAGKRPSMRPMTAPDANTNGTAENEVDEMIEAAANGVFEGVDDPVEASSASKAPAATPAVVAPPTSNGKPSTGRPRGRPPKSRPSAAASARKETDEQNRLAKLQALGMMTGESDTPSARTTAGPGIYGGTVVKGAPTTISMADALDDDDSDDGLDDIPARGPAIRG
ncbi:hypothetical protein LTR53_001543, partial [Teratosphaeriaceae sp. CCFEE 6253]